MPASQTLGILSFKIYTTNRLNWWHVALVAWTGGYHVYWNALSGEHSLIWNPDTVDISQMPRASTVSELQIKECSPLRAFHYIKKHAHLFIFILTSWESANYMGSHRDAICHHMPIGIIDNHVNLFFENFILRCILMNPSTPNHPLTLYTWESKFAHIWGYLDVQLYFFIQDHL